ncbi:hypothetical protein DFH06DRAFT_1005634 [Mycena polygramma]|nr:hypothetical protein DFH06DRAFT_1005634 [Mycena polygramma]
MVSSPSDNELQDALVQLKAAHPTLGIPKLHARLRSDFPAWTVSEKRMRKVLAALAPPKDTTPPHPSSQLVDGLDISQWTPRVDVRLFDKKKGKGLVATQKIKADETIWVEDPFVIAPEWEIYDKQREGRACSLCTTLFALSSDARARCSHCPALFCNALCRKRAEKTHALFCAAQNPASMAFLRWTRAREWLALHALAQCTARLVLAHAAGEAALKADWAIVRGFAALGMEERARYSFRLSEPDRETWKAAFALFCGAFHRPRREEEGVKKNLPDEEKKVAAILRKPLPAEIEKALFDYDTGFLRGLGRMSLNLEAHGGLYTLHAHLNHGCTPNASVRHLDQRRALARITVKALADIEPGQELLITYVNPAAGYAERRTELEGWGFICQCARCVEEGRDWKPPEAPEGLGDLASELKAGFGVM